MGRRRAKEIGDVTFPLEAYLPEDVDKEHDFVGKKAEVAPYADEKLKSLRGKEVPITGVVVKSGQIAGYEIKFQDNTYYGPKKDFYVETAMVEDIHLNTSSAQHIRSVLGHYQRQHDYYESSLDGVEAFHFELAKATQQIAIEAASGYRYPSTLREGMEGRNWRLLIPDVHSTTAVHCHSILHDGVWTLSTTIHSTRQIDTSKLTFLGHQDHWTRTILWTIAVAEALEGVGFDFTKPIQQYKNRLRNSRVLWKYVHQLWPEIHQALQSVCPGVQLNPLSIGFGRCRVEPNHIGRYEHPTDEYPYGILTINPQAWKDQRYLFEVIKHELIHHALGSIPGDRKPHGDVFQQMAKALGLPKKYRD